MKKRSNKLFTLIHTLTKSEKRYFKLFASMHKRNNDLIKLFDTIEQQETYDKQGLLRVLKDTNIPKHFHVSKNYLYNLILRSMREYHTEKSVNIKLNGFLSDIAFFYKKQLYDDGLERIRKGKKIAYDHENFTKAAQFLEWQKIIIIAKGYAELTDDQLKLLFQEERLLMEKIQNLNEYKNLSTKLFFEDYREGVIRNPQQLDAYTSYFDQSLLQSEHKALSNRARLYFNHIYGHYYAVKGDRENHYHYKKRVVELIEAIPAKIKEEPQNYVISLHNLLLAQLDLGKFDAFRAHLKKLRDFANQQTKLRNSILAKCYGLELIYFGRTHQYNAGLRFIKEIEPFFEKEWTNLEKVEQVIISFNIATISFGSGDYECSLKWLNRLINDQTAAFREDIYCIARVINLLVHFELGHFDLLDNLVKSTYRYLYKKERLFNVETLLLNYFKKLSKVKDRHELIDSFRSLKQDLVNFSEDPYESKALQYFDFIGWLESKISGQPFSRYSEQKSNKAASQPISTR